MKKSMTVVFIIILTILAIGIVAGTYYITKNKTKNEVIKNANIVYTPSNYTYKLSNSSKTISVGISKAELPAYLEKADFVKNLPNDAIILLRLYNFKTGEREWEESYVIKKGDVSIATVENPDMEIWISSKYLQELGAGFCETIKKANSNGDLGIELKMGKIALMWKYRNMMSYRGCLGL